MIDLVARLVFPFSLVVALGLWSTGYAGVGDGFSAGAMAGLGAVTQYTCRDREMARRVVGARWVWDLLRAGLLVALLMTLLPVFFGAAPVTHVPRPGRPVASFGALELHSTALYDLGVAVLVYGVFVGTFDRLFPPLRGAER